MKNTTVLGLLRTASLRSWSLFSMGIVSAPDFSRAKKPASKGSVLHDPTGMEATA